VCVPIEVPQGIVTGVVTSPLGFAVTVARVVGSEKMTMITTVPGAKQPPEVVTVTVTPVTVEDGVTVSTLTHGVGG
jgi:hypothetical protein